MILNIRILKLLNENIQKIFENLKAQTTKLKVDKLDFIKIKSIFSERHLKSKKISHRLGENIFKPYI